MTKTGEGSSSGRDAADRSQRSASGLTALLEPRSIAVIGVSRDSTKIGARLLGNIITGGYRGDVFPIHPNLDRCLGLPVYRSVRAIGRPVDLVFIAVPAPQVAAVVGEAAACGARVAVVISAGFAETGGAGRGAEAAVRAAAGGLRLVGPNCFGVINAMPSVSLHGTFGALQGEPGGMALAAESGAVGIMALDEARVVGLGLSRFVSLGNGLDVSSSDLIALWGGDATVTLIALYLESLERAADLVRIGRTVSRQKPIIVLKAGRTAAGTRAATSHTAAIVSSDDAADAVCAQAGFVRVETYAELLDVSRLLTATGAPRGDRVGIVTNSGGPAILLVDAIERSGLRVVETSAEARRELRAIAAPAAGLTNPIDLTAGCTPEQFGAALRIVAREVDTVVALIVPIGLQAIGGFIESATTVCGEIARETVCVAVIPSPTAPPTVAAPRGRVVPVWREPERAARAIAGACEYTRRRNEPRGELYRIDDAHHVAIRTMVERALDHADEVRLNWLELIPLLSGARIPCLPVQVVGVTEAAAAGAALGFPLVAKIVSRAVVHKSDVGGVIVDIRTPVALAEAIALFSMRAREGGFSLEGIMLQRYEPMGREGFVGVSRDPAIGPVVACGFGGTTIEVVRDLACGIPPLDTATVARMVDSLRGCPLLEAFRGAPAADRPAFEEVIGRVGALVEIAPEIVELDINPLKIRARGEGALALDGRAVLRRRTA